jgi:hypothetical protein
MILDLTLPPLKYGGLIINTNSFGSIEETITGNFAKIFLLLRDSLLFVVSVYYSLSYKS